MDGNLPQETYRDIKRGRCPLGLGPNGQALKHFEPFGSGIKAQCRTLPAHALHSVGGDSYLSDGEQGSVSIAGSGERSQK